MDVYTIYLRPRDLPDAEYAVRRHTIKPGRVVPGEMLGTADTLDNARALIPRAADVCLPEPAGGDPGIIETWI